MTSGIAWLMRRKMRKALRSYCFNLIVFAYDKDVARDAMRQATDAEVIEFLHDVSPGFPLLPRTKGGA